MSHKSPVLPRLVKVPKRQEKPAPTMRRSQLDDFTNVDPSRFESESHAYNHRSRNNLKRGKS